MTESACISHRRSSECMDRARAKKYNGVDDDYIQSEEKHSSDEEGKLSDWCRSSRKSNQVASEVLLLNAVDSNKLLFHTNCLPCKGLK